MKKKYIKPIIQTYTINCKVQLMAGSAFNKQGETDDYPEVIYGN
jgi:hypothetical protein